ncbi:MAG: TetR/AcrR family transcriptional regulator [Mycobacterium sp.]
MAPTEPTASRDKERTRRAILDAAEKLFSEKGSGVSLAEIAGASNVSKSGLLHHFPSRDALALAVAEDVAKRVWDEVYRRIDLADNRPGKFMRAYVRTLTGDSGTAMRVFAPTSLLDGLGHTPGIDDVFARDAEAWREVFAADGLAPGLCMVVRTAAEGLAAIDGSPYLRADELASAREELLALTLSEDSWA